jgi:hypothetical protein
VVGPLSPQHLTGEPPNPLSLTALLPPLLPLPLPSRLLSRQPQPLHHNGTPLPLLLLVRKYSHNRILRQLYLAHRGPTPVGVFYLIFLFIYFL